MKYYNVGDRVRIKSIDWYNTHKSRINGTVYLTIDFVANMSKYCGQVATITEVIRGNEYKISLDKGYYTWTGYMFDGLAEDEIVDLTSTVMQTVEEKSIQNALTYGYDLPKGYVLKDQDGNIINAQKIVLEKMENKYPETFKECRDYMESCYDEPFCADLIATGYKSELIESFAKLLVCRDAYWRIAGEEMGLEKPWEPDWRDNYQKKWTINFYQDEINLTNGPNVQFVLAFPTEEMRDTFYNNFKELIESCKELL